MKYSIGKCLAENGFRFYEELLYPTLLINTSGKLIKINEAGRKLMSITKVSISLVENIFQKVVISEKPHFIRFSASTINESRLHIVLRKLSDSDFY